MEQPKLNSKVASALRRESVAFPKPPNVNQIIGRWDALGAPGFQCLPGFRPGMAGEVGRFVAEWKKYRKQNLKK